VEVKNHHSRQNRPKPQAHPHVKNHPASGEANPRRKKVGGPDAVETLQTEKTKLPTGQNWSEPHEKKNLAPKAGRVLVVRRNKACLEDRTKRTLGKSL